MCDTSAGAIYGYNASCSVPGSAGKSTTFNCTPDFGDIADGDVWACVIAADASIPDNPSGPNQSATADKANLSNASCDGVVVDRTPPVAAINASSTSVQVGQVLSLQASASDATSGLTGPGEWTFGDSDAIPSGDAVTHVYDQPGTYEVTLTVRDKAGNSTTVRMTITVSDTPPPDDDDRMTTTRPIPVRSTGSASTLRASRAPGLSSFPSSSPRPTAARSRSSSSTVRRCSPRPPSGSTRTAPPTIA